MAHCGCTNTLSIFLERQEGSSVFEEGCLAVQLTLLPHRPAQAIACQRGLGDSEYRRQKREGCPHR